VPRASIAPANWGHGRVSRKSSDIHDRVRILRSRAEIEELRDFWNSCQSWRDADVDYYQLIIDLYPEAIRPHAIVVYEDRSPKALLLGRLEEKPLSFGIGYLRFRTNKKYILTFIHGGVVGDLTDYDAACLVESIRSSLREGEAEVACFESLDVNGALFRRSVAASGLLTRRLLIGSRHYVMNLGEGKKTFLESISSNERNNHKRRTRKLFDAYHGKIRIECFREPGETERLMRDAEIVASKSYQRGLGVGFHNTALNCSRFVFEATRGWLRGYVLYIQDSPAAYWIGSVYGGTFYSGYMAYDPAHARTAPVTYLAIEVLKELSASAPESVTKVDFGGGEAEYKARFGNHSWMETMIFIFAPRFRGWCLHVLWLTVLAIKFAGKMSLQRTNVFFRLRQYWRGRVTPT